jgi:hypothetical protein
MMTCSCFRKLLARTPRRATQRPRPAPPRFRPGLEALEGRLTPSSLGTTALLEGPAAGSASDLVLTSGAWSASANASWLHTSAAGTGNGLATFTIDANPGATRSGTLTIAGLTLTVTQAGSTYVAANPLTLVSSGLNFPRGVAVDGAGDVFIADYSNNAIEEWNASTQTVSTLVSGLNDPRGVAVDGAGNLFIADNLNNAIEEWNASTQTVSTLVSGLNGPDGVAVDGAGNVFIADTQNRAVEEWNASTQTVSTLVSGLNFPRGVAVDGAGDVYIADPGNNAIEELPRAFVPGGAVSEGPAAGTDALPPVLPASQSLTGPFAPSSDQNWLTVGPAADGVVQFSFAANTTGAPRTAHLTVLGQPVSVTQQALVFSNLSAPTVTYGTATTTISGQLGTAAPFPNSSVTITLDGVQQAATLHSDGTFSAGFDTHALAVTPGGYTIGFAYAGDGSYGPASASSTVTVTPATLTATADNQSMTYGGSVPALTYHYSGLVNGDSSASFTGGLTTTATGSSGVGGYPITRGSLAATGNYAIGTFNPGTLTVTPAPLAAAAANFSATAGAPFSGTVATFTTADKLDAAAAYTAVITWGDGSTSTGLITGGNGSFTVCGTHTYAAAASYAVCVQLSNPDTQSATANDTATVTSLNQGVTRGLTGGIGFWHNTNGQALIDCVNGGPSATALGNWLAACFPNLYGAAAGGNCLAGQSNAQVAADFQALFSLGGTKVQAQVLAVALNVYATTSSLGGAAGAGYGFSVSATGLGARSCAVGQDGAAFGVANNTTCNVYQLLLAVNQQAVSGVLYGGNAALQAQAAALFNALNQAGGIG